MKDYAGMFLYCQKPIFVCIPLIKLSCRGFSHDVSDSTFFFKVNTAREAPAVRFY
jgi:hypothetical protein